MTDNDSDSKQNKLPPAVERSDEYDTLSFNNDTLPDIKNRTFWKTYTVDENEDYKQNNS